MSAATSSRSNTISPLPLHNSATAPHLTNSTSFTSNSSPFDKSQQLQQQLQQQKSHTSHGHVSQQMQPQYSHPSQHLHLGHPQQQHLFVNEHGQARSASFSGQGQGSTTNSTHMGAGPTGRARAQSSGLRSEHVSNPSPVPPTVLYVRALYDYDADDRTSLSFRQGDVIQVITQLASGWWDGIINGVRGWFPSNYCVVVAGPEYMLGANQDPVLTSAGSVTSGTDTSAGDDEYEEYEDDGADESDRQSTTHDRSKPSLTTSSSEEAAFWIPQATPDGRLFYFNTLTGVSKVELPLETANASNDMTAHDPRVTIHASNSSPQHRPPPELMARGFEREEDETSGAESAAELEEPATLRGLRPRRRQSSEVDGISPAESQESITSPYAQHRGYDHQSISMNAVAQTQFASNDLPHMGRGFAGRPQAFADDGFGTMPTWNKMAEDTRKSIETYRLAINNADRSEYVRRVEDISDHLRMLLIAASGTTDNHSGFPSLISTNKALYPHFRGMMSRFSKLVLTTHMLVADFPASDSFSKCLQEAESVLHAIYGFLEVARSQRGEDIPRLYPGYVMGSANGGSWQNNGLGASRSNAVSSSFMDQDEYDIYNEPVVPLEAHLLSKMDEMKHSILGSAKALEDLLAVPDKLITTAQHEQIGHQICQNAGQVLNNLRPWISSVESFDLSSLGPAASNPQVLDYVSQKQRLYDLVAQIVLACQSITMPLEDEWVEVRQSPTLEERLADIRDLLRQLDSCISQISFCLHLLLDMIPQAQRQPGQQSGLPVESQFQDELRKYRTLDDATPTSSSSSSSLGYHELSPRKRPQRPGINDAGFANSYSEGMEPGSEMYRHRQQDNSKLKKFFGEMPRKVEEEPWYMKLEFESEISYDTKVDPPQLRGGTLIALVEQLTRHDKLDSPFNNTFLLTFKSFTSAVELFELLVDRFSIEPPSGLSESEIKTWTDKKQRPIRFRVVNILKSWLDNYWTEEQNGETEHLFQRVLNFAKESVATSSTPGSGPLMTSIEKRIRGQDPNAKGLVPTNTAPVPAPIMPKNMKKLKFLDIDATEFARQLTIIESKLYGKIKPTECLSKQWQKKTGTSIDSSASNKDEPEPAPNVKALILHSNQLTNWVAEMILNQSDVKKRVVVIKHFVAIADKCRGMNNFSTLTSIISALGTAPIHRLSRTWSQVNARTMNVLEALRNVMSSSKNFAQYRETLHLANPPCIPFFGIYLTDLTFIEDGIPSIIKRTTLINFAKRSKTAEVIRDIQQYQNVPYPLKGVSDLQDYIFSNMQAAGDVHEMYDRSLQIEPREREDEKIARLLSESGFL